jgi:hypothetical protein
MAKSVRRNILSLMGVWAVLTCAGASATAAEYGVFAKESGVFPDSSGMKRPYVVNFASRFDGAEDYFTVAFPKNFDPSKTYPLWFKFCPFYGSRSALKRPTLAWNYCDANDVILIGCNERGIGESWLGDNTQLRGDELQKKYRNLQPENIHKDVLELLSEMCHLFNVNYIGATGASMGGYASLRLMTHLPKEYVGVVVPSCPGLYFRPWAKEGSDRITAAVKRRHFDDALVKIMHGTADDTVPVGVSRDLTSAMPKGPWWELVEVANGKHAEFFCIFGAGKPFPHDEEWGKSEVVPDLWEQIHKWEKAHPKMVDRRLPPLPGWKPSGSWYLPKNIVAAAAKTDTSLLHDRYKEHERAEHDEMLHGNRGAAGRSARRGECPRPGPAGTI